MRLSLALLLGLAASPAAAWSPCDELWFTRNLIFDRAGYCFTSTLGRAVFDNADCTGSQVRLDAASAAAVAAIEDYEQDLSCAIDTSRRALDVADLPARNALIDLPVPSAYASACYGWRGGPITLHSGRSETAPVTGMIRTGDDLVWTFDGTGGWAFVLSQQLPGQMGWYREPIYSPDDCSASAG